MGPEDEFIEQLADHQSRGWVQRVDWFKAIVWLGVILICALPFAAVTIMVFS